MRIKDIFGVFKKKSFLVSLLFSIALWVYTSFNSVYKYYTTVPFSIVLPANRAIENDLPKTFTVSVQGTGWNLLNLTTFNNSKEIFIDWSKKEIYDSNIVVSRGDFLKGIRSMEGVQVEEISPEFLTIKTGRIATKKVPLISNINIIPNSNFTVVGKILLIPDSIELSGNEQLLTSITQWKTTKATFTDITQPFKSEILLSDSLNGIIKLNRNKVDFYSDIQQLAEIEIPDINIIIKGGNLPRDSYLSPPQISIVVQGGIKELEKLNKDKILVSIDINSIINDSTGVIIPQVEIPSGLKLLKMEPEYIYHYKLSKINNLSQLE